MWFKIKNSFIFGHLDIFWVIFTSEKKLENFWPSPVRNDHFLELAKELLDQIWRPWVYLNRICRKLEWLLLVKKCLNAHNFFNFLHNIGMLYLKMIVLVRGIQKNFWNSSLPSYQHYEIDVSEQDL